MRAHEFVTEGKRKPQHNRKPRKNNDNHTPRGASKPGKLKSGRKARKPRKEYEFPMQGIAKARDLGGYDRVYYINRLMMASAMADGHNSKAVDMDESSWVEKFNTMHPYTKEEANKIAAAVNTVPSEFDQVSAWSRSQEAPGGNVKSLMVPFAGWKKSNRKKA